LSIGSIRRQKFISREQVRADRSVFYLFGDNMEGKGFGGQAKAMRGEPNTIGVPTKWSPDMRARSFFTDDDAENHDVSNAINDAFDIAEDKLSRGHDIVIPEDGLGTGLAELPSRAPKVFAMIERRISHLEALTDGVCK
jgi:hypothetical protein